MQALIGPTSSPTIPDCIHELLSLCAEHHIERALLVSLDGDGSTGPAVSEAMKAIGTAGLAPGFKLGMVAQSPRTFGMYESAEAIAAMSGVCARAFRTREEAVQWLTGHAGRAHR